MNTKDLNHNKHVITKANGDSIGPYADYFVKIDPLVRNWNKKEARKIRQNNAKLRVK